MLLGKTFFEAGAEFSQFILGIIAIGLVIANEFRSWIIRDDYSFSRVGALYWWRFKTHTYPVLITASTLELRNRLADISGGYLLEGHLTFNVRSKGPVSFQHLCFEFHNSDRTWPVYLDKHDDVTKPIDSHESPVSIHIQSQDISEPLPKVRFKVAAGGVQCESKWYDVLDAR